MAVEPIAGRQDGVIWARMSGRFAGGNAMKFAEMIAVMIDEVDLAVFPDGERMP